jgi:hypothetical protein
MCLAGKRFALVKSSLASDFKGVFITPFITRYQECKACLTLDFDFRLIFMGCPALKTRPSRSNSESAFVHSGSKEAGHRWSWVFIAIISAVFTSLT